MVMVKTRKIMRRKIPLFRVHVGPGADYDQLKEIPEVQQAVWDFFKPRGIKVVRSGRCWVVTKPVAHNDLI